MKLQIFHNFLFLTDYIVLRARNIDLNEIFIWLCFNFFPVTYIQNAALYPDDIK